MEEDNCCGNCAHNKECANYQRLKENEWLCGLYQKGGKAYEQISLLENDYGTE